MNTVAKLQAATYIVKYQVNAVKLAAALNSVPGPVGRRDTPLPQRGRHDEALGQVGEVQQAGAVEEPLQGRRVQLPRFHCTLYRFRNVLWGF